MKPNAATHLLLVVSLTPLMLWACGPSAPPGELVASKRQRITIDAPAADLTAAVDGNADFGLRVYRLLGEGNLAFSPHSVTTALGMTYPGARGETEKAFEQVLQVKVEQARWHRGMNTLDRALSSRGSGAVGKDGKPFRLSINNQLFAQRGLTLLPDFLDVLASEYGAGVRLLDFQRATEAARVAINAWVESNTAGLIPELLQEGVLTSATSLALVNTIYFNAAWKHPFAKSSTIEADFAMLDGSRKRVATMVGTDQTFGHAVVDEVAVVALPYSGDQVSMVLLVPPPGKLSELEGSLTGARLRALAEAAKNRPVTKGVKMPKFQARTQANLSEILKKLGLKVAFEAEADFSGMTGHRDLMIDAVIHEAAVKTDEAGTEAAASTAVVVTRTSLPETVVVDRPFIYVVRDDSTGAVLFLGRVIDP